MLRNREFRRLLITMVTISLVAIIISRFISQVTMWLVIILSFLLIGSTILFTLARYRHINKLSDYLRKISSGDYGLDIRDNKEGELSILKNEIYKVTSKLLEHRVHLEEDKTHLTTAISDISHQLKTPLTSMTVMADLLVDPTLPTTKRKEFTEHIHVQLERLDWLVSSLLKLSKIDAGTITFKKDYVIVKDVINKALEAVLISMDIHEQTVSIQGESHTRFIGDFHWTVEAMINILKNCVEYTPSKGEITITYSENVLFTEIIIKDSGKGIPKKDLPYIFQRFYKGAYASEESVGIGLAMAHSIVESQGGDIEVDSEPNQGTEFRVKFYHHDR